MGDAVGANRASGILRAVIGAFDTLKLDTEAILKRTALTRESIDSLSEWVPIRVHNEIWEQAYQVSGDALIGLRVAGVVGPNVHEVLWSATQHSMTLGDAIIRLARFGRLLGTSSSVVLEVDGERTTIREAAYDGPQLHFQGAICQLGIFGLIGCRLTDQYLPSKELQLARGEPIERDRLAKFFGGEVVFGAARNALVFDSALLHLPVRHYDAERSRELDQRAQILLSQLPRERSFAGGITHLLKSGLAGDSIDDLADRLCLTPRTIARNLAAEGVTYQQLRDEVRKARAKEYLSATALSSTEIGIALGFSDGTAFMRAFKRWTGTTPSAFRAHQRQS